MLGSVKQLLAVERGFYRAVGFDDFCLGNAGFHRVIGSNNDAQNAVCVVAGGEFSLGVTAVKFPGRHCDFFLGRVFFLKWNEGGALFGWAIEHVDSAQANGGCRGCRAEAGRY